MLDTNSRTLQTDRLLLRLHAYASDPLVTRWRRGFGKEAAAAMVQFGFEQLQAHRLWADVFTGNTASVRILEGLGFREEGLALQSLYLRNSWHDILTFALLRTEWRARH
ncbi:MAG TPA: GNAT family protein [Steroidobacteraceae bacterium]|jgi:RimJ/RimL family protein N-acetyltransferase